MTTPWSGNVEANMKAYYSQHREPGVNVEKQPHALRAEYKKDTVAGT